VRASLAAKTGNRAFGVALVAGATVLWSTAGVYVRLLDLDLWTVQAWRSLFAALSLVVLLAADRGVGTPRVFWSIGWRGWAAVPLSAASMLCYVAALRLTTVANVMIVYATSPFFAAGIALLWLGERVERRVLTASAAALAGIAVMAGSATRPADIAGDAVSLLMTVTFAVLLVMVRRYPGLAMTPINALGAALCALISWPLMTGGMPGPGDLLILAVFGTTTTGLAYLLFLTGARHIPSSEAALIGLLDVVLGPFWVWLGFGEIPGTLALIGGGIVLAAVLWYLVDGLRAARG